MRRPVLGILGGVGPLATAWFMRLLIEKTPARTDQEHMPMIVFNDPQIPDRTAYILDHANPDPQPEMAGIARRLEEAGADYLAIPCNTAHYFYDAIDQAVGIPVLNIMEETARCLGEVVPAHARIGLMATEGTVSSGVFEACFARHGAQVVAPDPAAQATINTIIYEQVKANRPADAAAFLGVAEGLVRRGCDAVVVGCTELSVLYQTLEERPSYLYDSMDILADRCVEVYLRRTGRRE